MARDRKKPIAGWGAIHKWNEDELKPERLDADDFRGLSASMEMCEGARVLLKSNLWPEAGLMNGALGTVRGFVWPSGGGAGKKSQDPNVCLDVPLCVPRV